MVIADRQTLAGLYPSMLWTTPGNQETKAMVIADRQTLAGLYPSMLWTTPGNREAKAMVIADRQTLAMLYPYTCFGSHQGICVSITKRRLCKDIFGSSQPMRRLHFGQRPVACVTK